MCFNLASGLQPSQLHQPADKFFGARFVKRAGAVSRARALIRAVVQLEALQNEFGKSRVGMTVLAAITSDPFVETAGGHRHDSMYCAGWPAATMPSNETVAHCGSCTK